MQEDSGPLKKHRVLADMGFKEMQTAVLAELAAAQKAQSKLPDTGLDLARSASTRTQACCSSIHSVKALERQARQPDARDVWN